MCHPHLAADSLREPPIDNLYFMAGTSLSSSNHPMSFHHAVDNLYFMTGIYFFQLFDYYSATLPLITVAMLEVMRSFCFGLHCIPSLLTLPPVPLPCWSSHPHCVCIPPRCV